MVARHRRAHSEVTSLDGGQPAVGAGPKEQVGVPQVLRQLQGFLCIDDPFAEGGGDLERVADQVQGADDGLRIPQPPRHRPGGVGQFLAPVQRRAQGELAAQRGQEECPLVLVVIAQCIKRGTPAPSPAWCVHHPDLELKKPRLFPMRRPQGGPLRRALGLGVRRRGTSPESPATRPWRCASPKARRRSQPIKGSYSGAISARWSARETICEIAATSGPFSAFAGADDELGATAWAAMVNKAGGVPGAPGQARTGKRRVEPGDGRGSGAQVRDAGHANFIFGPESTATTAAAVPVANQLQMVLLGWGSGWAGRASATPT